MTAVAVTLFSTRPNKQAREKKIFLNSLKIILKESRYAKRERGERESSNLFSFQNKFKYKPSVFQNLFIVSKIFPPIQVRFKRRTNIWRREGKK